MRTGRRPRASSARSRSSISSEETRWECPGLSRSIGLSSVSSVIAWRASQSRTPIFTHAVQSLHPSLDFLPSHRLVPRAKAMHRATQHHPELVVAKLKEHRPAARPQSSSGRAKPARGKFRLAAPSAPPGLRECLAIHSTLSVLCRWRNVGKPAFLDASGRKS